jgi:hypothetical protein
MFRIEIDKSKNLLKLSFSKHVTPRETAEWREKLAGVIGEMETGFKLLTDLSHLELMDTACAKDIEWSMELLDKAGIGKVVRIIPDPSKDIGLKILSIFHYRPCLQIVTCDTMEEALRALAD